MIDWDGIARDADRSPAAILAEALGDAEDIETLVVIAAKKGDSEGQTIRYETSGQASNALGLVHYARLCLERHLMVEDDD